MGETVRVTTIAWPDGTFSIESVRHDANRPAERESARARWVASELGIPIGDLPLAWRISQPGDWDYRP